MLAILQGKKICAQTSTPLPQTENARQVTVPGTTIEEERRCLAEIKAMRSQLTPWKTLHNGMVAGDFAHQYVYHYIERKKRG